MAIITPLKKYTKWQPGTMIFPEHSIPIIMAEHKTVSYTDFWYYLHVCHCNPDSKCHRASLDCQRISLDCQRASLDCLNSEKCHYTVLLTEISSSLFSHFYKAHNNTETHKSIKRYYYFRKIYKILCAKHIHRYQPSCVNGSDLYDSPTVESTERRHRTR